MKFNTSYVLKARQLQNIFKSQTHLACCTLCQKKIRIDANDAVLEEGNEVKSTRRKGNMPTCPEKMETTENSDVTKTRGLNLSECSSIISESSMEFLSQVHIAANSEIGDHCLMYALSDSIHPQIAHPCQHQHNLVCVSCEQLKDATLSIQKLVECCTNIVRENEKLNDMNFKIKQSIQSINNLKRHIVHCKNQDIKAKSKLFETMGQDEDIETTMKNVKHRVSVVEYNPSKKTAFKAIPAIGSYSNFQFEEQGICFWKACGVGPGNYLMSD
ncbi:unnamed protein product [Mytilus edulis]|uniref:Uncharacterized protein n=1 Tax=Mytilus edulis TaxID=6550 RepID=A0A8S3UX22_MYTED|nr:unnamed protein product [Mytilus edulis]